MTLFLNDLGILIELLGFVFLISWQIPFVKKLKRREKTRKFYNSLFLIGFIIVILGLILQHSFFNPLDAYDTPQEKSLELLIEEIQKIQDSCEYVKADGTEPVEILLDFYNATHYLDISDCKWKLLP